MTSQSLFRVLTKSALGLTVLLLLCSLAVAQSTGVNGGGANGGSGVNKIIAGTNVTISPSGGTGNVTVNATGGGTPASPSGGIQYNNSGSFAASSSLVWLPSALTLKVTGNTGLTPQFSALGDPASAPVYELIDAASPANNQKWWMVASGVFGIYAVDDAGTPGQSGIQFNRSGTNITQSAIIAGAKSLTIKSTGDVQINGSSGTTGQVPISAGNGGSAAWGQVSAGNISGLAASATTDTTNATNISSGTLAVARGGTGVGTLTTHGVLLGEGTGNISAVAAMAADTLLQGQGASADPAAVNVNNCGSATQALSYSTSTHTFGCQTITGGGTPTTLQGTASSTNASYPIYAANGTTPVYDSTFAVSINPGLHTIAATTFNGNATTATLAATLTSTSSTTNANYPPLLGNGTTIQYDASVLINPSTHVVTATQFTGAHLLTVTTVGGLPSCAAGTKGLLYAVSDASAPTYNATVTGGGAVSIPVYCNGSTWTAH